MNAAQDLIILTQTDYAQLRRDLKQAGVDLCYMAQGGQPVRLDWSPDIFSDPKFLEQVAARRPADPSYRIASVQHTKNGGWFRPDEFIVTFHSVGVLQEAALQQYLADHEIQGSATASKEAMASS